jgi:imidazolonepropionase-like amidohydrolase
MNSIVGFSEFQWRFRGGFKMSAILVNANVIDGLGGTFPGWLVMDRGRILAIGHAGDSLPEDLGQKGENEITDLNGKTLMPGMIDAHVHITADGSADLQAQITNDSPALTALKMAKNCQLSLQAGFTTVRDLGGRNHVNLEVRNAINSGLLQGPTVLSCGRVVCMTGGHGWYMGNEADGPDQIRRAVRQELKAGADVIKLMSTGGVLTMGVDPNARQLSCEELKAGIEEAHNAGRKTTTHALGIGGVANAIEAGIDCIEHGFFLTDELIEKMILKDIWLVPTIIPVIRLIEMGEAGRIPDWVKKKIVSYGDSWKMGAVRARKAGVKIALGTDTGTPFNFHGKNAEELVALVDIGFEPAEVIAATTIRAAELLGLAEDIGSLTSGKKADLVVVHGDPTRDISILSDPTKIVLVYKDGKKVFSQNV